MFVLPQKLSNPQRYFFITPKGGAPHILIKSPTNMESRRRFGIFFVSQVKVGI